MILQGSAPNCAMCLQLRFAFRMENCMMALALRFCCSSKRLFMFITNRAILEHWNMRFGLHRIAFGFLRLHFTAPCYSSESLIRVVGRRICRAWKAGLGSQGSAEPLGFCRTALQQAFYYVKRSAEPSCRTPKVLQNSGEALGAQTRLLRTGFLPPNNRCTIDHLRWIDDCNEKAKV